MNNPLSNPDVTGQTDWVEDLSNKEMGWDYCPSCGSELDTAWECLTCERDWRPWATFEPNSIRDEGDGWCVWRLTDGVWRTDCGDEFALDGGGPKENEMAYCCFCGRVIGEA